MKQSDSAFIKPISDNILLSISSLATLQILRSMLAVARWFAQMVKAEQWAIMPGVAGADNRGIAGVYGAALG